MMKRLLLLAGLALALVTAVSADYPFPSCLPDNCPAISQAR
jgi:hypothetical protein